MTTTDRLLERQARAMANLVVAKQRHEYALETLRLAESNWSNIWPWRWAAWWRTDREVRRRLRALKGTKGVPA